MTFESTYNKETAEKICELVENGVPLFQIGQRAGFPTSSTIYRWLRTFPEFYEAYSVSKRVQLETLAEEILTIADNEAEDKGNSTKVNRDRLKIDSRKFLLERLMPDKFGVKNKNEISGPNSGPIVTAEVSKEDLARLIAFTASKENK